MECRDARSDLIALVQEELGSERSARLRAHLQSCPACLKEERSILNTLNLTRLVRMDEIAPSDGLFDRIQENLDARPGLEARPALPSRSLFPWFAAASLLLCLVAALTLILAPAGGVAPAPVGLRLAFADGDVLLVSPGGTLRASVPGASVAFGTEIRAKGTVRLDVGDGLCVVLNDGSLRLHETRARLIQGGLACYVPEGEPFRVETPHGEIRVHGTRFIVLSGPSDASVHVLEGEVELANSAGNLALRPGQTGRIRDGKPPIRGSECPSPAWAEILGADTLLLELKRPDASRPAFLEFKITNLSAGTLDLPRFTPDRPRFSLRIKQGDPPRGGVVNLARFRVSGGAVSGKEADSALLDPGRSFSLFFDVSPLLWSPGRYEVAGVYQCLRQGTPGLWAGQIHSRSRAIVVPEPR